MLYIQVSINPRARGNFLFRCQVGPFESTGDPSNQTGFDMERWTGGPGNGPGHAAASVRQ